MNGIIRVYDNLNKDFYRFTVVFLFDHFEKNIYNGRVMSHRPHDPKGKLTPCRVFTGRGLGKVIGFEQLPDDCKEVVHQDLRSYSHV